MDGVENHRGVRKYFFFIKDEVSSDWKDLAYKLGASQAFINNIAGRNRDDKSCCMDLLEEWLKHKGERATIEVLMKALSEANLKSTVDELKIEYPADISVQHSKPEFKVEELKPKGGGKAVQSSSIPLILPNDLKYNASTGRVEKLPDVPRKTLQVVPEALELLEGIEEPVSVLAICGPCRTGKSYILSRLLGTADAFELGHSMAPQTFGIWMGTKVLRGKDFTIVLLDTEGIDAVGGSAGQDASILVMTILLSSYLIYNSLNVPYLQDLEKMQCFIELTKRVTVKQREKTKMLAFREYFPDFLWLLRDVSLKMEDEDGTEMDPTDYLIKKVLRPHGDEDEAGFESTSDKVGRAIVTFFPSVECAKLERPSVDTGVMNDITQHTDRLNPEFNKGVQELTERLLEKACAKRGYDKVTTVSGVALSIMTKQYVEAVNDPNCIPALDNTWKNTIQLMQNRAIEEAVEEYNKQMQSQIAVATSNGKVPMEENAETEIQPVTRGHGAHSAGNPPKQPTLMDLHHEVSKNVTHMLLEKVGNFGISSEDQRSENKNLEDRLQNRLVQGEQRDEAADGTNRRHKGFVVTGGELLQYIQKNRELSKSFCQSLWESLVDPIRKHVDSPSPYYGFDKLAQELVDACQHYEERACGPEKWAVQQEMTKSIEKMKAEIEKIKGYQSKIQQAQQKADEAELRAKETEREMQRLRKQSHDLQQTQQKKLERMEQQQKTQIEKVKREMDGQHAVALEKILAKNAELEAQRKRAMHGVHCHHIK
ncbi:guanylate-binding protein 1-like [Branchiostoma floridae x Branchiostoma japonicum]